MSERQFFKRPVGLTLARIAELTGAELQDGARRDHVITNVGPLDLAGPDDLSFFDNVKYIDVLERRMRAPA